MLMELHLFIGKLNLNNRAAEAGDIEIAEILLDHDADIEALNYKKQTAFHIVRSIYIWLPRKIMRSSPDFYFQKGLRRAASQIALDAEFSTKR